MSETAVTAVPVASTPGHERPAFLDAISTAYSDEGKRVVVLTGDTHGLFWCQKTGSFLTLEQLLLQELGGQDKLTVTRFDNSNGLGFYDRDDLAALSKVCARADEITRAAATLPRKGKDEEQGSFDDEIGDLNTAVRQAYKRPLEALVLLSEVLNAVVKVRRDDKTVKPVCTIVKWAGSIFPNTDFDQQSELDRQKLVTFLDLIESPQFQLSTNLIILVADTRAEVSSRITRLPSVGDVQIELPNAVEREKFVKNFIATPGCEGVQFENGSDGFVADTKGLPLTALKDLLVVANKSRKPITYKKVIDKLNAVVGKALSGIARIKTVEHGPEDIVGYKGVGEIFLHTFKRCDKKKTAIPVVIVSGPNGGGKSFQAEAYGGKASGRLVLVLTGLRGKYFGETDALFEKLQLLLRSLGKILIMVDEAHTKFGSVHSSETHETEKRLSGNLIELMGDPSMFGDVVWVLMTSRPDLLDPDILSRSPVQIPIFDLEDEERKAFVVDLFTRKGITIPEQDVEHVLTITASYSNRDLGFLVTEVLSRGISVRETLEIWQATSAIRLKRKAQEVIAAQNCSYPALLPKRFKDLVGTVAFEKKVRSAKRRLAAAA